MFVAGHNLSHHKNLASLKDIARTSKMRFKWNLLNQLLFFFWTIPSVLRTESSWSKKMLKERPRWFFQYSLELVILYGVKIGLLFVDWQAALILVFVPHFYAQWGIVGTNYWQHDGCDMSHAQNHSRNFTNPVLNFFFFNNGFHGLHHKHPTMHWSELPKIYEEEWRPHLHPNLDRKSLAVYLWESCIYPGKRLDYSGNPVVLPTADKDKDQSWVPAVVLAEHKEDMGAIS
ncbi:MAG: fatty acid desaturase [Cytophagales bacterium]|nr:fatty acid desaturase [Cytophagales bacterium]